MEIVNIAVKELHPDSVNPTTRVPDKELIESIRQHGILNPLLVRKNGDGYIIVGGERRWLAAKELKLATLPCIVRLENECDATTILLTDNVHRKNMTCYEEYQVIARMLETQTIAEVSRHLGKTVQYIVQRKSLVSLIPEAVKHIQAGTIGFTPKMAFVIAKLPKDMQKDLLGRMNFLKNNNGSLTCSNSEQWVEDLAVRLLNRSFFEGSMKPVDLLAIYGGANKIGETSVNKVVDSLFDDKKDSCAITVSEEEMKEAKKMAKLLKELPRLTENDYASASGVLKKSEYRIATKADAPDKIFEGVFVDGKNAGVIASVVTVTKKDEDNAKKPMTDKERAERKEKILVNKATNAALEELFTLVFTEKLAVSVDLVKLTIDFMDYNKQVKLLKALAPDMNIEYNKVPTLLYAKLKHLNPLHALQFLLIAPQITWKPEEIAKLYGYKFSDIIKQERKLIIEEKEKE